MDIWGYYNPFMRPIQVDFVNIRAAGRSPPAVILRRGSPPLPVILRSFAPKNLQNGAFETGGKILRCAQNDNGERLGMTTGGEVRNDNGAEAGNDREKKCPEWL